MSAAEIGRDRDVGRDLDRAVEIWPAAPRPFPKAPNLHKDLRGFTR